jgi:leucyl/phenylalanyl-tRNA--protein transferase
MIPWLAPGQPFPPVETALKSPNGLLAASAGLGPQRLLEAYPRGIFPWYSEGEPVLWWSPDPRMVLFTSEFRVSRSLAKTLKRAPHDASIEVHLDRAFDDVIRACAEPRAHEAGTWITDEVIDAYSALNRRGLAHSVETWVDGRLAGGLYGVAIGRMFFGESMFARVPDASKIALAALVRLLLDEKARVIDCQQNTRHLSSLGGREIRRRDFLALLRTAVNAAPIDWAAHANRPLNALLNASLTSID